jgi:hypothetical protein
MEIIKLNLHSQVLFLGKLIKDSETNQILNTSNNNISNNNNNKKELA